MDRPFIYSSPLYKDRCLKKRRLGAVAVERIISRSKSNNAASGSSKLDGKSG
jgi:hypothetical protein